jgi:DNA-binding transcriptional regulator PaaX
MLVFDIPEGRRYIRQKVRNTLRSIGFYRLQDSVWVFPYDCSEFVTLLKADFKVGKDLLYLIADSIEDDIKVKDYFNLGYKFSPIG